MPTFKWTFAAGDNGASKMLRDTTTAVKEMESAANSAGTKTAADLDKVAAAADRAARSGKSLSEGFGGGLSKSLEQGLTSLAPSSVQNVSSQFGGLGAAFGGISTGAAAATAGIAVAGVAAVKFGVDAVKSFESSAKAVDDFQDVAGGSAKQASVMVGAAQQLGVSSDQLATGMARLAKNVGNNDEVLKKYGVTVVRTSDGSVDMAKTFAAVAEAFAGTEDPAKRAALGTAAFGRGWADLTDILQRAGPELDSVMASAARHAPIFSQKDLDDAVKLREQTVALGQEWDKFKVKVGEKIFPTLEDGIRGIGRLGAEIDGAHDKWDSFGKDVTQPKSDDNWLVKGLKNVNQLISEAAGGGPAGARSITDFGNAADTAGKKLSSIDFSAQLHEMYPFNAAMVDAVPPVIKLGDAADITAGKLTSAGQASAALVAAVQGLGSGTAAATAGSAGWANALDAANTSLNQGSVDAAAYADAQTQGARQIASAEKSVTDAISGVNDAQEALAKTSADAARSIADAEGAYAKTVVDANQKVADVEASTSKSIVDAQQRVTDARHAAAEAAVSSARRVEDATQALLDAESSSLSDPNTYSAQRKREDAAQGLTRAQEDAAQQQADSADTVGRAQQTLADVQVQASQDRARAEQDAADQIAQAQQRIVDAHNQAADQIAAAQKRVSDANDKVGEANGRLKQTTDDVALSLEKAATKADGHALSLQGAQVQAQAVVDASPAFVLAMQARGLSLDDINTALAGGKDAIEKLGVAFGIPKPVIDAMIGQLDTVLDRVLAIRDMTRNAYDWWAALVRSVPAGVTAEQAVADASSLGITIKPTHDSGGWLPVGMSLAVNNTGRPERVLSPAEMDAHGGMGGGMTIVVQGAVISDRDLADIIAKAMRRGYKGFGN